MSYSASEHAKRLNQHSMWHTMVCGRWRGWGEVGGVQRSCLHGSDCLPWNSTVLCWLGATKLIICIFFTGEMIQQTVDTLCSTTNLRNRRVTKTRHEWAISKPAAVRNWEERGTLQDYQNSFRLWRYFYQILTQNTYSQPSAKIVMTVWFYQTCKVSRERRSILNKSASV